MSYIDEFEKELIAKLDGNGDTASLVRWISEKLIESYKLDETKIRSNSFGPRVAQWIGKMVGKATAGTWKIGTNIAADLLTKYVKAYYGLEKSKPTAEK